MELNTGANKSNISTPVGPATQTRFFIKQTGLKIVSEYEQEIPQSQTADNPKAPRGRATQPPQDTRETN